MAEESKDKNQVMAGVLASDKQAPTTVEEEAAGSDAISEAPEMNGNNELVEQNHSAQSDKPTEIPGTTNDTEDSEMKGTEDAEKATAAVASPALPTTNGTPAPSKRASVGGSSKKRSAAVPEHKSKKLNKKKSRPMTNLSAQPGEYYIARMKGHPPWPSVICDEDMLPSSLLTTRPVTARLADGSFKKPEYADGGKRAYERTYPIMFLHTNEFAWIPNTELTSLDVEADSTKNPIEKGKKQALISAYKKAAENQDLDHFKSMLADHERALEADRQDREEAEKERSAKKAKKSRKSDAIPADDGDEMDIDEDAVPEKPKSKKRKKTEDSDEPEEKPAKTPKTTTKLKLSTPKTPAAEPSTKKKAAKPKSAKAPKSASEDDAATPKVEEKQLTAKELRENKEKKVLYYRHKLQRGFLARDIAPKEDEMKAMSDFLGELELYPDLEGSIIRTTKIHKVLKAMIKLGSIPLEEEYHFKSRSSDLLGKWNDILSNESSAAPAGNKETEGQGDDAAHDAAPKTNGETKNNEEQAQKAEAGEAIAPEEESEAKMEKKIGTTVEGEKEADDVPGTSAEKTFPDPQKSGEANENGDTEMAET